MKGKIKSIFIHIINVVLILFTGLIGVVLSDETAKIKFITGIVLLLAAVITLAAEIILIVYQAKHKYGKAVFISGLVSNIVIVLGGVAAMILSADKGGVSIGSILEAAGIILAGAVGIVLHSLIRKDNLAVAASAPKKVIAEEKLVETKKPVAVKKASTKKSVTKNKPTTKKKK